MAKRDAGGPSFKHAGIPTALAEEILALVRAHPWLGKSSLSDFATRACQEKLERAYALVHQRGVVLDGRKPSTHHGDDEEGELEPRL